MATSSTSARCSCRFMGGPFARDYSKDTRTGLCYMRREARGGRPRLPLGLRVARTAAKIACLPRCRRLRRKSGRLFVRFEKASAKRKAGNPSYRPDSPRVFIERDCGEGDTPRSGSGPCGRETTSGKVRCSDYRKWSGRLWGGDPGGRTWPESGCGGEGPLPGRDLPARRLHSHQGAAASRRSLRSVQKRRGAGFRGQRAENQLGQRPLAKRQNRQEAFERHRVSLQEEPGGVGAGLGKVCRPGARERREGREENRD